MMVPGLSENVDCPRDEIASYIDGEMSLLEGAAFETHLTDCEICRSELKHQKEFLFALSSSLDSEKDIPLPKDFTRIIVANAESRVSGLRNPTEQFTAVFIGAALFLFILFAVGGDVENFIRIYGSVTEKPIAVGSFLIRQIFNVSFSIAVVIRSLFSHLSLAWALSTFGIVLAAALLFAASLSIIRGRRTQEN